MNECKSIIKKKAIASYSSFRKSQMYSSKVIRCDKYDQDSSANSNLSKMSLAFGAPIIQNKIKRIRSSFHLDDHCLEECEGGNAVEQRVEMSPVSDCFNKIPKTPTKLKIDPSKVLKQAYKSVKAFGSSTACV